jgi:hypothetical protein
MEFQAHCARQQCRAADVRFGSKADMTGRIRNVRFTPKSGHRRATVGCPLSANKHRQGGVVRSTGYWNSAAKCPLCAKSRQSASQQKALLFHHLIRSNQKGLRDGNAEALCSFEIDDELEFSWLLDGEIGRPCPSQNAINVSRSIGSHAQRAREAQ